MNAEHAPAGRRVLRRCAAPVTILILGFLPYYNSLENSFHYDDEHSIVENPHIRSLSNIPQFFVDPGTFSGLEGARMYRPLTVTTLALNYVLGEYEPFGYHLVNLFFHLANATLLWILATRLGVAPRPAFAVALLFVVHPLGTEPVNYISSRSSLLTAFCYLLGFVFLARSHIGGVGWIASISACYLGGLASKAVAASFPLVAASYLWGRSRAKNWQVPAVLLAITALYVAGTRAVVSKAMLEPVRPFGAQVATQLKAVVFYIWTVAMPVRQSVEPQFFVATGWVDGPVLLALAFLVTLAAVTIRVVPANHWIVLPTVWFFAALLPPSIVPLHVLVNEHRLYLSMVGFMLMLGYLQSVGRAPARRLILLTLLPMIALSIQRNRVWATEEMLWADAVAKGPGMARPHVNLGKAYIEKGDFEEAIAESRKALAIEPSLPRAYYNIGWAYHNLEELELAVAHYNRAIELEPDMIEAYNNLGNAYQAQGRADRAFSTYYRALEVQPAPQIYHNLGSAFFSHGEPDSAIAAFETAIRLAPDERQSVESYKGLAKALRSAERHETALATLRKAQRLWPEEEALWVLEGTVHAAVGDDPAATRSFVAAGLDSVEIRLALGDEARKRRDWARALGHYEYALNSGSKDARVYNARGEALFASGELSRALQDFRTAARTDSELAVAYTNIGRVQMARGRGVEAAAALERAVELDANNARVLALLGKSHAMAGKMALATKAYARALALEPESPDSYSILALLYEKMGSEQEAEEMYNKALAVDASHVPALYSLGTLLLRQHRKAAAIELLQQAIEADDSHKDALLNLGAAYVQSGDRKGAIESYERFLKLHGEMDNLGQQIADQLRLLRMDQADSLFNVR